MPVHWYYDREALKRDYGFVQDYLAPRSPHPDSILWRSSYQAPNPKGEILHDQARYWGQKGIHYHQFLQAGENTLNIKLCSLLIQSLNDRGGYDPEDYLQRYIEFMTTPGNHRDTYIEEAHRHFFSQYARGASPEKCAAEEKHIGGLVGMAPLALFYQNDAVTARKAALEHLALTHEGPKMKEAGELFLDLLLPLLEGRNVREAVAEAKRKSAGALMAHPFDEWLDKDDAEIVAGRLSTACYVDYSIPAVAYLAMKYSDDPERGLVVNTNLGGDNVHRGAVLGALLGAANGLEGFPPRWVEGLREPPPEMTANRK